MKTLKDEPILLAIVAIVLAIAALWAVGCGSGGGTAATTPTAPSTAAPAPAAPAPAPTTPTVTVSIVGIAGSAAFSPNPVQASSGATIVFRNTSGVAHHLVMDEGTVIGDIAAGAVVNFAAANLGSQALVCPTCRQFQGTGGNYHCTTHPTMVGSINGASAPADPTPNPSGGYDY